jgi:arginine repressor
MEEIVAALRKDQGTISQTDYSRIISELQDLGYTGKPERWHDSKDKISKVLPEKIQWFVDNPGRATEEQIRQALKKGGVEV